MMIEEIAKNESWVPSEKRSAGLKIRTSIRAVVRLPHESALRPSNLAPHMTQIKIAARKTVGRNSTNHAYEITNAIVNNRQLRRLKKPNFKSSKNPLARIPTCSPDIASKWDAPDFKNRLRVSISI